MERLRVVHIIGGGELGGAERHILNLAGFMDPRRVALTVCCLFAAPFVQVAREAGIQALAVPMRHKLDFGVVTRIVELVHEADLVHTHGVRANLLGRIAARLAGRPLVTTVHSLLRMDYPTVWTRLPNALAERLTRRLTRRFIAVSRQLAEELIREGVAPARVRVIYNGIDVEAFQPCRPRDQVRRELGYGAGVPLVATVARLHPVKGHRYLLEAAQRVVQVRPEVRFLVVGAGPGRGSLEAYAGRLGIAKQVKFTGFVEDVASLLGAVDLVVVPSLWEGFGLTAVEALNVGVPVVATAVGGLPEVVRPRETGLLVPPGDSEALAREILWALSHPVEVRAMAERGRDMVRREFTARIMAHQTTELYFEVVAGS
ncbi:MAG: glycosyltransferase [Desulfotomaculales bacterium]